VAHCLKSSAIFPAMPTPKTIPAGSNVSKFLESVVDETRRNDAKAICKLMERVTGEKPEMWGKAIVGFGHRKLVYPNGRETDWMVVAFSPRKTNTVLYGVGGHEENDKLLAKLGKHTMGKGCLYINKLADIDSKVLEQLVKQTARLAKKS
jgi:hypothetical protein